MNFIPIQVAAGSSDPPWMFFAAFGGFLLLFAAIFFFVWWSEKKRAEAFSFLALKYGFEFRRKADAGLINSLSPFALFNKGRGKKAYNQLNMKKDNNTWTIFDYKYTVGSGKNSSTYNQSVAYIKIPDLKLPCFSLTPESFFHKIGDMFGYSDIDFNDHPVFSDKYFLKGPKEDEIRDLFSSEILTYFEKHLLKWNVEGLGDKMVMHQSSKRIKPVELSDFVRQADEIISVFVKK